MALDIIGIENIVIAQNKVDLVDRDTVVQNHEQIREFTAGTVAADAPIVPISAQQEVNIDLLMGAIQDEIPTPARDPSAATIMHVARSFDINRPGTTREDLTGGVIGGSLESGELSVGDDIELRPGIERDDGSWEPVRTRVRSLQAGGEMVETASPGGLLGVGTGLDPSLAKGDALAGQVAGPSDTLPPTWESFTMAVDLLDRIVGEVGGEEIEEISTGEPLMMTVGTATTVGAVTSARPGECEVSLKRPICARPGAKIAINRRMGTRWRLIGVGTLADES